MIGNQATCASLASSSSLLILESSSFTTFMDIRTTATVVTMSATGADKRAPI